jgi:hypothetical protein
VATQLIKTGDHLRVNGSTGIVEILAEEIKESDVVGADFLKL